MNAALATTAPTLVAIELIRLDGGTQSRAGLRQGVIDEASW